MYFGSRIQIFPVSEIYRLFHQQWLYIVILVKTYALSVPFYSDSSFPPLDYSFAFFIPTMLIIPLSLFLSTLLDPSFCCLRTRRVILLKVIPMEEWLRYRPEGKIR